MRYREIISEAPKRPKLRPTERDMERIRRIREETRREVGGGGYCHEVSDWIEDTFGWPRCSGAYTDHKDDTICDAHVWNVLPDGAILDATADQFGEGHDVRIIEKTDPDHPRYRDEWFEGFHPGHPEYPHLKDRKWSGEFDGDRMDRLRKERGAAWWVQDKTAYNAYQKQQTAYSDAYRKKHGSHWKDGMAGLEEAAAYLDQAEIQRIPRGMEDSYYVTVPLDGGATLRLYVVVSGTHLEIVDIETDSPPDHPDRFKTTNNDWDAYEHGVRLGTAVTRRLLMHVLKRVRQDHPQVKTVSAERRTGLRYATGNRDLHKQLAEAIGDRIHVNPSRSQLLQLTKKHDFCRMAVDDAGDVYVWSGQTTLHSDVAKRLGLSKTAAANRLSGLSLYAFPEQIAARVNEVGDEEVHPELTKLARQLPNIVRIWGEDVAVIDMHGEP